MITVEFHPGVDALPPEWDELFEAGPDLQSSRAWFRATATAALAPGDGARFVAIRESGRPAALVPMRAGSGAEWRSLTSPYTCLFQPLFVPDASPAAIAAAARAFGRQARQFGMTVLEALDPEWSGLDAFRTGLGRAGLPTRRFAHFGNWHEALPASWEEYLAARPGKLRTTVQRKWRAAEREDGFRLEWVRAGDALPTALAAYEAVYRRSWKEPEPHPDFSAALVSQLQHRDVLRFALLWAKGQPVAAQYWTVFRGRGTVLKLAHDDAFRAISPGTVLTAFAIRELMGADGIREIDFGRGDDDYKQGWARQRRQRIGLAAFNPFRPSGAAGLLRHDAGPLYRFAQNCLRKSAQ